MHRKASLSPGTYPDGSRWNIAADKDRQAQGLSQFVVLPILGYSLRANTWYANQPWANMESDRATVTANEIRLLCTLVTKLAGRDLQQRLDLWDTGISPLQHAIMRLLRYEEQTISELSKKFNLDPSTLVPAVDALERKGLARRGQDPKDRRCRPLSLTERGAELIAGTPAVDGQDSLVQSLADMGDGSWLQLLNLLRELVSRMSEEEDILQQVSARVQPGAVRKQSLP
jgi:DNA-binding MarR family transcriptional regulator